MSDCWLFLTSSFLTSSSVYVLTLANACNGGRITFSMCSIHMQLGVTYHIPKVKTVYRWRRPLTISKHSIMFIALSYCLLLTQYKLDLGYFFICLIMTNEGVVTAGLEGTNPGVFIVMMMMVTLPVTMVVKQSSPLWLYQSRSVSGPACWLSVLLQSVPRCRRVLTHTDTHPHHLHHIHPGGPPPWVWIMEGWFLSVSVSCSHTHTHTHTHTQYIYIHRTHSQVCMQLIKQQVISVSFGCSFLSHLWPLVIWMYIWNRCMHVMINH